MIKTKTERQKYRKVKITTAQGQVWDWCVRIQCRALSSILLANQMYGWIIDKGISSIIAVLLLLDHRPEKGESWWLIRRKHTVITHIYKIYTMTIKKWPWCNFSLKWACKCWNMNAKGKNHTFHLFTGVTVITEYIASTILFSICVELSLNIFHIVFGILAFSKLLNEHDLK